MSQMCKDIPMIACDLAEKFEGRYSEYDTLMLVGTAAEVVDAAPVQFS